MPVFIFLIILFAILLWYVLARAFSNIGNFIQKTAKPFKNAKSESQEIKGRKDKNNE